MEWLAYLLAALFAVAGLGCVFLVLVGLPGLWLMIGLAVLVKMLSALLPAGAQVGLAWAAIGSSVVLAVVAELLETVAGVAGTRAGGGSRRGMVGALLGGIVGGIALTPVVPIPVAGTLLGALIGTFMGALAGELTAPTPPDLGDNVRAATGATIGRLLGTMGKLLLATVAWVVLVVAAFR